MKINGNKRNINFHSLSANPTKWSNILKQFVGNLPTTCLSGFDHFVKLALKGSKKYIQRNTHFSAVILFGNSKAHAYNSYTM